MFFPENQDFTDSVFVKFDALYTTDPFVSFGNNVAGNFVWRLGTYKQEIGFGVAYQGGSWSYFTASTVDVFTYEWYHVLSVYNNNTEALYVDGQLLGIGNHELQGAASDGAQPYDSQPWVSEKHRTSNPHNAGHTCLKPWLGPLV